MLRELIEWRERLAAGRLTITVDTAGVTVDAAGQTDTGKVIALIREYGPREVDGVTGPGLFMLKFESEWTLRRRAEQAKECQHV